MAIATARKIPEGANTVALPLDMLDPIDKIREPHFYEFVKKSIESFGLYHPIVVCGVTEDEWKKELELDHFQTPPPFDSNILRWRIQCGCNRFYALRELGYDAVECIVMEDVKDARDACHMMRIDKRWQRGSSWAQMHEGKK